MAKRNNTLTRDTFIVVYSTTQTALPSGDLVGTGTSHNIGDGEIGVISVDHDSTTRPYGEYIVDTDLPTAVRAVKVIQGTPKSANTTTVSPFGESDKGYVASPVIHKDRLRTFTAIKPNYGSNNILLFDGVATPLDEETYSLDVTVANATRHWRDYGYNPERAYASIVTPDYTTLGTVSPTDHLLQNLASLLIKQSRLYTSTSGTGFKGNKNFLVLGVNSAGGSGTDIDSIAFGDSIDYLTENGQTFSFTTDRSIMQALGNMTANAAYTSGATIEVIDVTTAGAAANVDTLLFIGLDEIPAAAFSDITNVRTKLNVEFSNGFRMGTLPTITLCSDAVEAVNTGANLLVEWRNRAMLQVWNQQNHQHGDYYLQVPTYLSADKIYTRFIIEFYDNETVLSEVEKTYPKKVHILMEAAISNGTDDATTISDTGYTYATSRTALAANLETIFGDWLQATSIIPKGIATASTFFS